MIPTAKPNKVCVVGNNLTSVIQLAVQLRLNNSFSIGEMHVSARYLCGVHGDAPSKVCNKNLKNYDGTYDKTQQGLWCNVR